MSEPVIQTTEDGTCRFATCPLPAVRTVRFPFASIDATYAAIYCDRHADETLQIPGAEEVST